MRSRNVESRQLGAWLFAGLAAPAAQFAGGMCWRIVALTAVICLLTSWLLGRTAVKPGKWVSLVEYGWLVYVLAAAGDWITGSWPGGNVYPAVPLTLLALGAASACRGSEKAARAGGAVFWLTALIYSGVVASGVGQVEIAELWKYEPGVDLRLPVALLIPALIVFLPGEKRRLPLGAVTGIALFAVVLSALVTGTLSPQVALTAQMPLYKWVERLTLAGTLQRFEALVSVALTMGWFALVSFVLCVAAQLTERIKRDSHGKGVWFAAGASALMLLCKVPIKPEILAAGSLVLWVVLPAICVIINRNKILKNSKNSA